MASLCVLNGWSRAQTFPFVQEAPSSSWNVDLYTLTIHGGTLGRTYFMQWSGNLTEWIYLPWMETGNGSDISLSPDITQTSRNFFKLLYSDSPGSDFDNDGLSNSDEVKIHGLDPFNSDFDGDEMPDGWEIRHGLNPKSAGDAQSDLDVSGLSNLEEFQNGTDPTISDTDGDSITDSAEVLFGDNPLLAPQPPFHSVTGLTIHTPLWSR